MTDFLFFFCCFSPFTGINCNLFYIKAQAKKKKGRGRRPRSQLELSRANIIIVLFANGSFRDRRAGKIDGECACVGV